jgi:uncharacterized protein YjgD (DUF1641 family)
MMAKPVTVFPKLRSEREELLAKLSDAPVEHAAALLDLYELVQVLHKHGTLDLLRGLVGASDDLIGRLAAGLSKPESIRASRNVIEMTKLLSQIDPEALRRTIDQGGQFLASEQIAHSEPPGLWNIFRRITSRDGRRALALIVEVLNEIGSRLKDRGDIGRTQKAS